MDGLRGVAIGFVLIGHLLIPIDWGARNLVWLGSALYFCDQGVDIFFVLSGFLIGRILLRSEISGKAIKSFYIRRAFRILPIYWLLLLSFLLLPAIDGFLGLGLAAYYTGYTHPIWKYLLFIQNNATAATRYGGAEWLGVTWSLAVEEQFYLLAPWFVRWLSVRALALGCVGLVAFCPVARWAIIEYAHNPMGSYVLLICRADSIAMGILVAIVVQHRSKDWLRERSGWFGVIGLVAFLVYLIRPLISQNAYLVFFHTNYAISAAFLLLYLIATTETRFAAAMRWRPLVFLGSISYFVYLFHLPARFVVITVMQPPVGSLGLAALCVTLLAVISLAYGSRNFIERPLIELGRRLSSK